MQYYTSMEMYADNCTDSQVHSGYTYRWNNVSEILSEDVWLTIYFRFKVLNIL